MAGPKYLIKNRVNGILIPINEEKELVGAIEELLESEELRKKLGNEARNITKELNNSTITNKWISYIEKVGLYE